MCVGMPNSREMMRNTPPAVNKLFMSGARRSEVNDQLAHAQDDSRDWNEKAKKIFST